MKKQVNILRKETNQLSKQLSPENNRIYTDICIYIRSFPCTDFQQEILRSDILSIMLEGQQRGDSMEEVIGQDYQEFCNRVYEEIPHITPKQQRLSLMSTLSYCVAILLTIQTILTTIDNLMTPAPITHIPVTLGNLLCDVMIILCAIYFINHITTHALSLDNKKTILFFTLCFIAIILVNVIFTQVLFQTPLYLCILVILLCYALHKILDYKTEISG